MNNYKLIIQYDGNKYKGWQRLGNTDDTVQARIENVLSKMLDRKIEIIGCSRTDTGVHALGQVANFMVNDKLNVLDTKNYINKYLPEDICVTEVIQASERFHARYNANGKTYLYKIWNKEHANPFMRKYSMYVKEKLNIEIMREASKYFLGEHDFTAYTNAKSKSKSMLRNIKSIEIKEINNFIEIRISGDGFLHNMARRIIGTLIEIGLDRKKGEDIPRILELKKRDQTGEMALACGLYLEEIRY
ncbi:MAG: tRNA pseudouridine(38-40) synthase TruA [Clostridiales bacterium GWE2_32_10]|nr:MAG: tRNA pseudouridine(38-40) synthase TruA [Clostridiales bacterium GWE2_32_10]HBY20730.1 tRNA pseudouridine(38-40) synthase TruA [Clostridiales bacterium]